MKLTQKELKRILHYNKITGIFTWRVANNNHVKIGDVAGTLDEGYIRITIDKNIYRAHRLAFLYIKGYTPKNLIDHKNRRKNDNRWTNLREVTKTGNSRNCNIDKRNKSGVTGVSWFKKSKKWKAYIRYNKKLIHLGTHKNILNAVIARYESEKKYGFLEFNQETSAFLYIQKHQSNQIHI